jgi:SAM-dependent methyltransferase
MFTPSSAARALARVPHAELKTNRILRSTWKFVPGGQHSCPVCRFEGRFAPVISQSGLRLHAACPGCGALERHRLQAVAMERVASELAARPCLRVLHIAPEPHLGARLRRLANGGSYVTGDIEPGRADLQVDLREMGDFADGSWDLIWASHVLEHVDRDVDAVREVARVLSSGGIAVLPVPIVACRTVEYSGPSPAEHDHVRAPGFDYYDRFMGLFRAVELIASDEVPESFQTWVYEDRSFYPTPSMPERPAQPGTKHIDFVPICHR